MVTHCGATLGTQGWGLRLQGGGLMAEGARTPRGHKHKHGTAGGALSPSCMGGGSEGGSGMQPCCPRPPSAPRSAPAPSTPAPRSKQSTDPSCAPPPGPNPMERSVWKGGLHRGSQEMLGLSAHVWLSSAELAWDVLAQEIHSANPVSGD